LRSEKLTNCVIVTYMQDVYLSLNNNILRLTYIGKEGLKTYSSQLAGDIVSDTKISDISRYAEEIKKGLAELTKISPSKLNLIVVTEPEDTILRFITVNKRDGDKQEQLLNDMKAKITEAPLEDLYFSYQKIAPFLYQFVGVRKPYMDDLLEVVAGVGISLKNVVPWILLMPKYVGTNDPAVFICRIDGSHAMALSELNGIFYSGVSDKKITAEQLESFVSELSLYKKKTPVKRVYTLNYQDFDVKGFEVSEIGIPPISSEFADEFKINMLVNYMLDTEPDISFCQMNLLNLMPLPAVVKSNKSLVYVGAASILVIAGVLSFFLFFNKKGDSSQLASGDQNNVLSEQTSQNENQVVEQPAPELKKSDLKIKVLNGSGINGLAARTKTLLEEKGYTIIDIDTADETRDTTLFRFKKDKLAYKDLVQGDTKEAFPEVAVEDTLADTEGFDVLIVAGSTAAL